MPSSEGIRDWPAEAWECDVLSDIRSYTVHAGWAEMDELVLGSHDLEIRLWTVGGVNGEKCRIIRCRLGQWTWNKLVPTTQYDPEGFTEMTEGPEFGRQLEEAGLFTVEKPDFESSIDQNTTRQFFIAVQAKLGNRVRSFRYGHEGPTDGPAAELCRVFEQYRL